MKIKDTTRIKTSPYLLIIASFLFVIIIGSLLLIQPFSQNENVNLEFIDALFISTSATCVTGLSTVNSINETFSVIGKIIIIILMEVGGLSLVTFTTFILILFRQKLGFSRKNFLANALNQNSIKGIIPFLKNIVILSFSIQGILFILNIFALAKYYDNFFNLLLVSLFHTASSFNNAGFDLFGSNSMINFSNDIFLNITTMLGIILGGLGFFVIGELIIFPFQRRLSFHSKAVILMTSILIFIPTLVFRFTMNINWLEALFTSVTARTAGFTTIDFYSKMHDTPAFPLMLLLMFVGASPSSTGGGIKTTTFFTIIMTIAYGSIGKKPKAFKRNIAQESITKSFSLVMISLAYIILLIIGIKFFEKDMTINDIVFEAFSAFGTVGVSMGITSSFSLGSKILICLTMFVGRVGPLSFVSFCDRSFAEEEHANVKYVEEKVIIG